MHTQWETRDRSKVQEQSISGLFWNVFLIPFSPFVIHNSCQGHFKKAAKLLSKTMTSLQEVRALPNCHFCFASNFDFEVPFEVISGSCESQDDCYGFVHRSRVTSCDILFSRFVAKIIHGPLWQLLVPMSHKEGWVGCFGDVIFLRI